MNAFKNANIPLTANVIANLFGSDTTITNPIRFALKDTVWDFEVGVYVHVDFFSLIALGMDTIMRTSLSSMLLLKFQLLALQVIFPPFFHLFF